MEIFWGLVSIAILVFIIMRVVRSCNKFSGSVREARRIDKEIKKRNSEQERLKNSYAVNRNDIYRWLNELNTDYNLGLEEEAIKDVANANSEAEAIERIKKYIDPSPILPMDFMDGFMERLDVLLKESPLSEKRKRMILAKFFNSVGSVIDEKTVEEIAQAYSRGIPDKLSFMRGKIHYTFAALGFLYQVAEEEKDGRLKKYVREARKKRGFGN